MGARARRLAPRAGAVVLGLALALVALELALRLSGLPRYYAAKRSPSQFAFLPELVSRGEPFYVNMPSSELVFRYDGDPRGYFGPDATVVHRTNEDGFRGPAFGDRRPGVARVAFLGDSFTFGEGVRFEDTFPEVAARVLGQALERPVEAYNFGVGGHNTAQSLQVYRYVARSAQADVVVLGYVLNDAEGPLYEIVEGRATPARRPREETVDEGVDEARPPERWPWQLRLAQLVWKRRAAADLTRRTLAHYRALYEEGSAGWAASREALVALCREAHEAGARPWVVIFPILVHLGPDYPFAREHALVADAARGAGAAVLDLLPVFARREATELWVHPTDQHPNEVAHRMAGEALARALLDAGALR